MVNHALDYWHGLQICLNKSLSSSSDVIPLSKLVDESVTRVMMYNTKLWLFTKL